MSFVFSRDMGRIVAGAIVATYAVAIITAIAPNLSPAGISGRLGGR